MGAPKGPNTHPGLKTATGMGRGNGSGAGYPRIFASGGEIIMKFINYRRDCQENPIMDIKAVSTKEGIELVEVPKPRPLTLTGFAEYVGCSAQTFRSYANHEEEDLRDAIQRVREMCTNHNLERAFTNIYHPGIVARYLGLSDDGKAEQSEMVDVTPREKPDEDHIANRTHPEMTTKQIEECYMHGITPPLYSPAQIASGIPYTMPDLSGASKPVSNPDVVTLSAEPFNVTPPAMES